MAGALTGPEKANDCITAGLRGAGSLSDSGAFISVDLCVAKRPRTICFSWKLPAHSALSAFWKGVSDFNAPGDTR
jgi:hypothetical protein